ncbi:MAG: sugar ABC transporter permease [Anaerolineae bacterium]|nr:sugar ABC transporter permease [Anaerolineae bacterium]
MTAISQRSTGASGTGIFGWSRLRRREIVNGYLYMTPWLIGLLVFYFIPILWSFILTFTDYNIVRAPIFLGIANYKRLLLEDSYVWPSLYRTFYYAIVMVPVGLIASLLAAMLLNQHLNGTTWFRTFFFLPTLTPAVAAAFIWKWLMHPEMGLINYLLWQVGIKGPGWMSATRWVIPSMMIVGLWGGIGGTRMLIFLAGLQGVPQELYEAAEIDGANSWHKFLNVTLPMISPTFLFNLILGVIGALQVFTIAFTATDGGPGTASTFFTLYIYRQAFEFFSMGYASALAWFFLVVILALTLLNFHFSGRWVYYEGEVRR